jgi:hypothetical protein
MLLKISSNSLNNFVISINTKYLSFTNLNFVEIINICVEQTQTMYYEIDL